MKRMRSKLFHAPLAVIVIGCVTLALVPRSLANSYTVTFKNTTGAPADDLEILIFNDGTVVSVSGVGGHANPGDDWTGSSSTYMQGGSGVPLIQFMEPTGNGAADMIQNNSTESFNISMTGGLPTLATSLAAWWTVGGNPVVGNVVNNGGGSYTLTTANGATITQTPLFGQSVTAPETPSTLGLLALSACGIFGLASKTRRTA